MRVFREEIFGPVTPLYKFSSDEEAVRLANATEYGLAAYFYTQVRWAGGRCVCRGVLGWAVRSLLAAGAVESSKWPGGSNRLTHCGRDSSTDRGHRLELRLACQKDKPARGRALEGSAWGCKMIGDVKPCCAWEASGLWALCWAELPPSSLPPWPQPCTAKALAASVAC